MNVSRAHQDVSGYVQNGTVLRCAQYIADMWLPLVSFGEGASYATRITEIEYSEGYVKKFGPRLIYGAGVDDHFRIKDFHNHMGSYGTLSASNHRFKMAMQDYANALRISEDTSFYCYRALETLMHHYCEKCKKVENCRNCQAWNKMHDDLRTSKCAIDPIKQYADKVRHGHSLNSSDYEKLEVKGGYVYMLKYVRDTLQNFVIRHNPWPGCKGELPQPDYSELLESMTANCTC